MAVGGLLLGWAVILLVRRQLLSLRYGIGWLLIALSALIGAILSPAVKPLSSVLGLTPTGLLLSVASAVLVAIAVQLSVSVSGLRAQIRELAEAHALLESRVGPDGERRSMVDEG
ncbi:MAG: DUF2304 family protein [Ilumatobacteraceae bacterium]